MPHERNQQILKRKRGDLPWHKCHYCICSEVPLSYRLPSTTMVAD
jgi:hypothetical protein